MESTTPTTKPKIVFARSSTGPEFFAWDYDTFKPVPNVDLGKKTLPQCIEALKDTCEIAGFFSHGMIIPLIGLIPGHENKRIEDARERVIAMSLDF